MHALGDPQTMQDAPAYDDVLLDVARHARRRASPPPRPRAFPRARILVDPGIGFGKTVAHNLALIRGLAALPRPRLRRSSSAPRASASSARSATRPLARDRAARLARRRARGFAAGRAGDTSARRKRDPAGRRPLDRPERGRGVEAHGKEALRHRRRARSRQRCPDDRRDGAAPRPGRRAATSPAAATPTAS